LLDILCCPQTKQSLALMGTAELDALNNAITKGPIKRGDGGVVAEPVKQGLVTRDHKTIYRIDDGIPVLLADEAIDTAQIADFPR
jgi:uncharacterized protein YbaR (Trm112 family)